MSQPSVNPNGKLSGQVAVITGASRGIGDAIARRYAMEGAKVVVAARSVEASDHYLPGSINETVAEIRAAGGQALAVRCDLSIPEDRESLIAATEAEFGSVDILVNNAAVTFFIPVQDFSQKRYQLMLDVQVYAPFELAQRVLPAMIEKKAGRILNISSHAAIHPAKDAGGRGGTVYGMCKAALERFTTGLASEVYDDHIGVNVISPGLVATPGVMHHKLILDTNEDRVTPVEVMSEACLRLVHGDAQQITGRIDYADEVLAEFGLEAADLI